MVGLGQILDMLRFWTLALKGIGELVEECPVG